MALALLLIAGAACVVLVLWAVHGAGGSALRRSVALVLWLCAVAAVLRFWRSQGCGALHWDGLAWTLDGAAPEAPGQPPLRGPLDVHLDLQSYLWVCLHAQDGRRVWLWLEQRRQPERWGDLRRAVYSRARHEALPTDPPTPSSGQAAGTP